MGTNNSPGGWGTVINIDGAEGYRMSGGNICTTNNIMEMQAIISGVESIIAMLSMNENAGGHHILIVSDSKYVVYPFMEGWIIKWLRCGWRMSATSEKMRPNAEIWQKFVALISQLESMGNIIKWKHVRGHRGIHENEICDQMAGIEKEKMKILSAENRLKELNIDG